MADDKAKLLRSLAIDRGESAEPTARRRRWPVLAAAGGAVVVALVVAAVLFGPELRLPQPVTQQPSASQPVAQQAAPASTAPAAAAEPRRTGSLAASGYVVARRKATIAAEITGKVVEVLVEEGMVVE